MIRRAAVTVFIAAAFAAGIAHARAGEGGQPASESESVSGERRPDWMPADGCAAVWARNGLLRGKGHLYDWEKDVRRTEHGNEGYASYLGRLDRAGCRKDWTILVYMAADNDLTPYAFWDLYEMEAGFASGREYGASTRRTDLLVQVDVAGNGGVHRLHLQQRPAAEAYDPNLPREHFETMKLADVRSPVVARLPEPDAADPSTGHEARLRDFLAWGMKNYPAKHYMVVVWGHGQGWTSVEALPAPDGVPAEGLTPAPAASGPFAGRRFGGLAFQDGEASYLDIPALRRVLDRTKSEVLQNAKNIDLYASDACLMQMAEVAYEISGSVDYVVGSAQVQDFQGLPYRTTLYELNTGRFAGFRRELGTDDEPYLLAHTLPEMARRTWDPSRGHQGRHSPETLRTFTMTSLSAGALRQNLIPAMDEFSRAAAAFLREDPLRAIDLLQLVDKFHAFQGSARDLAGFATRVKQEIRSGVLAPREGDDPASAERLIRAADAVREAVLRTALRWTAGTDYQSEQNPLHLLGFKGLSAWLPGTERDYRARQADFDRSNLYRDSAWEGWINALFDPFAP